MYNSTRGKEKITASQALIKGIASDGGLFVTDIKKVNLDELKDLSYNELTKKILSYFLDDFSLEDISECVDKSYKKEIMKIHDYDEFSFLELYYGPTLAFKDVALTLLPNLLSKAKEINNNTEETIILTATSGDTGAAALNGFKDIPNMRIVVLYPNNGISQIQEEMMQSYMGENVLLVAYDGSFDDCQSFVKNVFKNQDLKNELKKKNKALSSANSINIGRLVPQIVYYFYTYFDLVKRNRITYHDKINFVVPSGNFGDILAGYYALLMGLPINKLICASNKNNVLTDFFDKGIYDIRRDFYKTNSPSMDILISSNLERYLYECSNKNDELIKELMESLAKNKYYEFSLQNDDILAFYSEEKDVIDSIKKMAENGYLMDTHTSVGYNCYQRYLDKYEDDSYSVILSTASPYKFIKSIGEALDIEEIDEKKLINKIYEKTNATIPNEILDLEEKDKTVWNKSNALSNLREALLK